MGTNIRNEDMCLFIQDGFWLDVAETWAEFNYYTPNTKAKILQQKLWLNSALRINGRPVCNKEATEAKFIYIGQIITDTGIFKDCTDIKCESMGTVSLLEYHSIVENFDINWKRILRSSSGLGNKPGYGIQTLLMHPNVSSYCCLYRQLCDDEL